MLGSVDGPTIPRTGSAGLRRAQMASFLHLWPLLGHWVTALLWGGDEAPSHRSKASGHPSNSRDSEVAS